MLPTTRRSPIHTVLGEFHSSTENLRLKTAVWSWNTHHLSSGSRIQTLHLQLFVSCELRQQLQHWAEPLNYNGCQFVPEQLANVLSQFFLLNNPQHQHAAFADVRLMADHKSQRPRINIKLFNYCNCTTVTINIWQYTVYRVQQNLL